MVIVFRYFFFIEVYVFRQLCWYCLGGTAVVFSVSEEGERGFYWGGFGGGLAIVSYVVAVRRTVDPRPPTMPGRSTSGFRRPGRHCADQARSAVRCSTSGMTGELHPTTKPLMFGALCVRLLQLDDSVEFVVYLAGEGGALNQLVYLAGEGEGGGG